MEENGIWLTIAKVYICAGFFFFIAFFSNDIIGIIFVPPKYEVTPCQADQVRAYSK
jgi:hypothetical protein